GKRVVMVYPVDKWVLMLLQAGAQVRNLGDVRWLATEDGSAGKGTGRHIACLVLDHDTALAQKPAAVDGAMAERIAALLYEEATGDPWTVAGVEHEGPDRDYYRKLARKVLALAAPLQAEAEVEALREALRLHDD